MCNYIYPEGHRKMGQQCSSKQIREYCTSHIHLKPTKAKKDVKDKVIEKDRNVKKTYTGGPEGRLTKPITCNDFAQICKKLQTLFDKEHSLGSSPHTYIIRPEPITEGGIEFIRKDLSNTDYAYKSMRIHGAGRYPWIPRDDHFKPFEGNQEIMLGPSFTLINDRRKNKNKYIGSFCTTLKSFGSDSNPWTTTELQLVEDIFIGYGIKFVKEPKSKDLIYTN